MTVWELFGYGRAEETADSVFSFGRPIQIHAEKSGGKIVVWAREARTENNRKKSRADDSSLVVRFGPIASSLFSLFALLCWWNEAHSAGVSSQEGTWEVLQAPVGLGSVPQEPSIASLPFQEATQQD